MGYKMPMNDEKRPNVKKLLPEGWRLFEIVGAVESTSKSGNQMFIITAKDVETGYEDTWYAVAEPKKRWFLKTILAACGCAASEDGVYDWELSDILNKSISGLVEHEDNEWINRDGETVTNKQHKVVEVQEIGWDD